MIFNPGADIALPELDEPVCCTTKFSDNGAEKKQTEYWQSPQELAGLVGITTID